MAVTFYVTEKSKQQQQKHNVHLFHLKQRNLIEAILFIAKSQYHLY